MITSVTAAVAAAALAAILGAIVALLRLSAWAATAEPSRHGLADHPDAVRPRAWDEVTADHSTTALRDAYVDDSQEIVAPVSAPPVVEGPIDELDPRWDWQAHADRMGLLTSFDERYALWETPAAVAKLVAA